MTTAPRFIITALLTMGLLSGVQANQADEDRWVFRVLLDSKEIGYHEFRVLGHPDDRQVEISAEFDVRILFISAYSYDHRNTERWSGDCLAGIEAFTNDNGDEFSVSGERAPEGFVVNTNQDSSRISSDCVRSFAYWNPVILESERLLNSQTGEIVDVQVRDEGPDTLNVGPHPIPARKYTLLMKDGPINLWYSPGGQRWLALEAPAKGGRTIRYEPVILPGNPVGDTRFAME